MSFYRIKKLICLLIASAVLLSALSGCAVPGDEPVQDGGDTDNAPEITPTEKPPVSVADRKFTLDFDPAAGFNPMTGESSVNTEISSLIYESLFVLDGNFEPQPKLCAERSTEDGLTWMFRLVDNVAMHDGSTLTAEDAVYSLLEAKRTRYASRFEDVVSASAVDALTFTVTLSRANMSFDTLLDIPIIKKDSGAEKAPAGTGPYTYSQSGSFLLAFKGHRDVERLPVSVIYLNDMQDSDLTRAFSSREIDLIIEGQKSENAPEIYVGHEMYEYCSTVFQYVGFNVSRGVFMNDTMRRAVSYAVNREYITETVTGELTLPAYAVFPSVLPYYDESCNACSEYSTRRMSEFFAGLGLEDSDSDGFLELPNEEGVFEKITIEFLVNGDSEEKTAAAREIAYTIRSVGIDIAVKALPWDEYIKALRSDEFDMYYAETKLTPDFDLSELLCEGGSLNYGGFSNEDVEKAVDEFLAATAEDKQEALRRLCWLVSYNAPIMPVLYKEYCVRANRGTVTGLSPSVSGVFCGISDWKISF